MKIVGCQENGMDPKFCDCSGRGESVIGALEGMLILFPGLASSVMSVVWPRNVRSRFSALAYSST